MTALIAGEAVWNPCSRALEAANDSVSSANNPCSRAVLNN